jgi:hypothetical protein
MALRAEMNELDDEIVTRSETHRAHQQQHLQVLGIPANPFAARRTITNDRRFALVHQHHKPTHSRAQGSIPQVEAILGHRDTRPYVPAPSILTRNFLSDFFVVVP